MKKIILLIIFTILSLNLTEAAIISWCTFTPKFKEKDLEIIWNNNCVLINVHEECMYWLRLWIEFKCEKKYDIFDENNKKIVSWINKKYLDDFTIPQKNINWERKLVNIKNPNDIIIIKWENEYIKKENNLYVLISFCLMFIIILILWIKFSNKK